MGSLSNVFSGGRKGGRRFPDCVPAHAIRATNSQILDPERLSRQSPARRSFIAFPTRMTRDWLLLEKEVHMRGQPL